MSSLSTDNSNKRPALDSPEDTSSRPSNKRTHTVSRSPSVEVDVKADVEAGESDDQADEPMDAFKEPLDIYRRDAISRQWKEYMRSGHRLLRRVETTKDRKLESNQQLQTWQGHLNQLKTDLQHLLTEYSLDRSINENSDSDIVAIATDDWINERTVNMKDAVKQAKKSMVISSFGLADILKSWSFKRTQFTEKFDLERLGNNDLVQDYKQALSSWLKGQNTTREASHQYRISKLKFLLLCEELRLLRFRLGMSDHILQETRRELLTAEKRLAKKDSTKQVSEQLPTTIGHANEPLSSNEQVQMRTITDHQQDPIIRTQKTLEQQLREIETIKEQRIDLKQQIVQLEIDLVHIPESRTYKSSVCRQLYQSREYQRDKTQNLTAHVDKLVQDVEDMRRHRRRLMEEMDTEQMIHIRALEERLANLEYELTRVRGQRDELQCKIEMGKADSQEGRAASVKEWQIVADTRKQRSSTLETELARWLQKWAAHTGSREFYHYVTDLRHHVLSLDRLVDEQRELETNVSNLKQRILSAPGLTDADGKLLDEELDFGCQLKLLQDELNVFKATYGFDPTNATPEQVIDSLQQTITKEQAAIRQARQRVEVLQSTENQLLDEIGNIAKVYGEFDEQNTDKIKKLAQDEDDFIQLQCERVKYSQTFTALNKSKDAHTMVASALTKQIEKQMTYIKQLNEREKNLGSQIASLERQLGAGKAASDIYQQKVTELKSTVDEAKEKVVLSKEKVAEVEQSIMDTIRSIEEGAHSRLRIEEDSELLWRKIEATTKVENPAEMKLRKEKEEFRSLLNCSSCRINFKSHVLMRCMHTFCKDCLDSRIETRQRRCPNCGEPFGINDVKQFYL